MKEDSSFQMERNHPFLVCVDSDGCVFDNMELKHKECFCPATVNIWGMQNVSRYTREVAEYVNLYSRMRGINRFPGLVKTLEMTAERPEVKERGYVLPDLGPLKEWIKTTPSLSAFALEKTIAEQEGAPEVLKLALAWSREVDDNVHRIAHDISPFPFVKEALQTLGQFADIMVVSAAARATVQREWTECGLASCVNFICGQELGSKAECIQRAMNGHYAQEQVLKIGDAPGDLGAAETNGVLFHPIIPGQEAECWKRVSGESAVRFHEGTYRGDYMDQLISQFFSVLSETPPWESK